jgi:hypothetical protein
VKEINPTDRRKQKQNSAGFLNRSRNGKESLKPVIIKPRNRKKCPKPRLKAEPRNTKKSLTKPEQRFAPLLLESRNCRKRLTKLRQSLTTLMFESVEKQKKLSKHRQTSKYHRDLVKTINVPDIYSLKGI